MIVLFEILSQNPNLPLFVISEIQKKTSDIKSLLPIDKVLKNSVLMKQIQERRPDINPFHLLFNFLSMTIFPFVARPIISSFHLMNEEEFHQFVEERKTLIPQWIKLIFNNCSL